MPRRKPREGDHGEAPFTIDRSKHVPKPRDYRLTISFDSAELREMFCGWLSDGGGVQDFMSLVVDERGSALDIDYDSGELIVVNEFPVTKAIAKGKGHG